MQIKTRTFESAAAVFSNRSFNCDLSDPETDRFLTTYSVLQQFSVLESAEALAKEQPNHRATRLMLSAMSLIERTRARLERQARADEKAPPTAAAHQFADARDFIQAELKDGPRPAQHMLSLSRAIGISARTLNRAKAALDVISFVTTDDKSNRIWSWRLAAV